jgi:hypothetical protein
MRLYRVEKVGRADAHYPSRTIYEGKLFYGKRNSDFPKQAWGYIISNDNVRPTTFHQVTLTRIIPQEEITQ